MWKIILSGLVMLNPQPNEPAEPRYNGAEEVHVLLVDARQIRVDSDDRPIAAHTAVLEVPFSCLEAEAQPDWKAEIGSETKAYFLLDDASLHIRSSDPTALDVVTGTRPLDQHGELRLLPCCSKDKDCPTVTDAEWICEVVDSKSFVEQRRDLTWLTAMGDLDAEASLAPGCLPPRFTGCPLVSWLTIDEGTLETHLLEGENPGNTDVTKVAKTKIDPLDSNEPARAAAREILWTVPRGSLTVELVSFSGVEAIPLKSSCDRPLRVRNEPLDHILHSAGPHPSNDHISQRHAEHLFRLLASPPEAPDVLSEAEAGTMGSGLCPPGDTGGP